MNADRVLFVITLATLACVVLLGASSGQVGRYQIEWTGEPPGLADKNLIVNKFWRVDTATGRVCEVGHFSEMSRHNEESQPRRSLSKYWLVLDCSGPVDQRD